MRIVKWEMKQKSNIILERVLDIYSFYLCKIHRFHQIEKKRNVACHSIKNFEIELEDRNKI